jgi:hypothetical protein
MGFRTIAAMSASAVLGIVGLTACSHESAAIQVQSHSREDLKNFDTFTYQTATASGLDEQGTRNANKNLDAFVNPVVNAAATNDKYECATDNPQCGVFIQKLTTPPCASAEYFCVKQDVGGIAPGAGTGQAFVSSLLLNSKTGSEVTANDYFGLPLAKTFTSVVEHAATSVQLANGFYDSALPPRYTNNTLPAWLPQADGIHVWFNKYEVASGADGIVEIIVKENGSEFTAAPAPRDPVTLVANYKDAIRWLCSSASEDLPTLSNQWASFYPVSAVQLQLQNEQGAKVTLNGIYDQATSNAVKAFQKQSGLFVDGQVHRETWLALQRSCETQEAPVNSDSSYANQSQTGSTAIQSQTLIVVPNLIGLGNNQAKNVGMQSGITLFLRANSGDPSLAAQTQGLCTVVAQNPVAGSQVSRNSVVNATMQCPSTGYQNGISG